MKFYEMGNGNLVDVAGRGTTKTAITKLQEIEWVRKQGGICGIKEITTERGIYFATRNKIKKPVNSRNEKLKD